MKWISFTDIFNNFYVRKIDELQLIARENKIFSTNVKFVYKLYFKNDDEFRVNENVYNNILSLMKENNDIEILD